MTNPPRLTYRAEYNPDMEKMVEALKIIKEAPTSKSDDSEKDELQEGA